MHSYALMPFLTGRATSHWSVRCARSGSYSLTASTDPERCRPLPFHAIHPTAHRGHFHHHRWAVRPM